MLPPKGTTIYAKQRGKMGKKKRKENKLHKSERTESRRQVMVLSYMEFYTMTCIGTFWGKKKHTEFLLLCISKGSSYGEK